MAYAFMEDAAYEISNIHRRALINIMRAKDKTEMLNFAQEAMRWKLKPVGTPGLARVWDIEQAPVGDTWREIADDEV